MILTMIIFAFKTGSSGQAYYGFDPQILKKPKHSLQ